MRGLRRLRSAIAVVLLAQAMAAALGLDSSVEAAPPACGGDWDIVESPTFPPFSDLRGVAAASPTDVWAVGRATNGRIPETLVEHWDGAAWTRVPSPNYDSGENEPLPTELQAVTTIGPQAWAVGYGEERGFPEALIEIWNGSTWAIDSAIQSDSVPLPPSSELFDVDAVPVEGGAEVWTVGYQNFIDDNETTTDRALIAERIGDQWVEVDPGRLGSNDSRLYGVDVAGPDDVWVVGNIGVGHWTGQEWVRFEDDPVSSTQGELRAVEAISPTDVWAVGFTPSGTLAAHYDGTSWTVLDAERNPTASLSGGGQLLDIEAVAPDDIWAVGNAFEGGTGIRQVGVPRILIQHWDGERWTVVPGAPLTADADRLAGLAAVSSREMWAVGGFAQGEEVATVTERCLLPPPPPTLAVDPDCSQPEGTAIDATGENFAPTAQSLTASGPPPVTLIFDGDVVGSADADAAGRFTETVTPPPRPAGNYELVAAQGEPDDPGFLSASALVRVPCRTVLAPVLSVDPPLGPPGFVTLARGTGFPSGATVELLWEPGLGRVAATADDAGTFEVPVLILPRDILGPRRLVAQGFDAEAEFLVVPGTVAPPGFSQRT